MCLYYILTQKSTFNNNIFENIWKIKKNPIQTCDAAEKDDI